MTDQDARKSGGVTLSKYHTRKCKKGRVMIRFLGPNSWAVTGSMTLVQTSSANILLEAGLYQSSNIKDDFCINNRTLGFNPRDIDFIILGHVHADHSMLIPRLYANGCKAKILAPTGTTGFYTIMGKDSSGILERDCRILSKRMGKQVKPYYCFDDVRCSAEHIQEIPYGERIDINKDTSIRFSPSGHIIGSAQTELWVTTEHTQDYKILYTSDLGTSKWPKHYISSFEPVSFANMVIGESTYGNKKRQSSDSSRETDISKILSVVQDTEERGGRVLIPIFSLDRCQNIMTLLYELYHDCGLSLPILVDSPLAIHMNDIYSEVLTGDEKELFRRVCSWQNFRFVESPEASTIARNSKYPAIVLAASGMMTAGRSKEWVKTILPDKKSSILFVGYSSEGTLAYQIRHSRTGSAICVDHDIYPNNCRICELHSFSSHMQYDELLKYYSTINCDRIFLVHGNKNQKPEFARELQKQVLDNCHSSRVIPVIKSMEVVIR